MSAASARTTRSGGAPYWVGRVVETLLLLAALVGIGMFAWSIVDIVRIESGPAGGHETSSVLPPYMWPGVLIFVVAMVLLQIVRVLLVRVRREDGTPRADARGAAAAATAEALAEDEDDGRALGAGGDSGVGGR